jgi:uncharacterized protein
MTLFLSLLPIYLFGNLHCLGMCGPLVMLISRHQNQLYYLLGRLISYSLTGLVAGGAGALIQLSLKKYYFSELIALACGGMLIWWGARKLMGLPFFNRQFGHPFVKKLVGLIGSLLRLESHRSLFFLGFLSIALPCGQTIIVFSACALTGDPMIGFLNGLAFAIFTSPSLIFAMKTFAYVKSFKSLDRFILGGCSIVVGVLSCCRGLAELQFIPHLIINPHSEIFHLVVY